jgi:hypothetical protein
MTSQSAHANNCAARSECLRLSRERATPLFIAELTLQSSRRRRFPVFDDVLHVGV